MASEVSICNMALGHIKSKSTIASLDEESNEAKKCKLFYSQARDETLEEFNWHFAKRNIVLAEIGTAPLGWAYQYAYPADGIAVRRVITAYRDDDPVPFELAHSDINDTVVILTDREAATIEYTKRVTNTILFSPLFIAALSYKIASYIAMPLTGKQDLRDDAIAAFNLKISEARASSLNQGQKDEEPLPSWLSGR